jgi:hypothetical protein
MEHMERKLAYWGAFLLLAGLICFAYGKWNGLSVTNSYVTPDRYQIYDSCPSCSTSAPPPPLVPLCQVKLLNMDRHVRVHQSFNLIVEAILGGKDTACESTLQVLATAFDVEPHAAKVVLKNDQIRRVYFNFLPKEAGSQQIVVINTTKDGDGTEIVRQVSVYEYPFIPPGISFWFSTIATVFGGILTIPWWLERLHRKSSSERHDTAKKSRNYKNSPSTRHQN